MGGAAARWQLVRVCEGSSEGSKGEAEGAARVKEEGRIGEEVGRRFLRKEEVDRRGG